MLVRVALSLVFIHLGSVSCAPAPTQPRGRELPTSSPSELGSLVLVSDIDDTLKATHVRDALDLALNGLHGGETFADMPELYGLLANSAPKTETREIAYVSAAVGALQYGGKRFLDKWKFPTPESFFGRPSFFKDIVEYKVQAIQSLIDSTRPGALVLLNGDNGEKDVEVFDRIIDTNPDRKVFAFVHQVYDEPLEDSRLDRMTVWLTAFDLGLSWSERGWIPSEKVLPWASHEIPSWVECKTFLKRWMRFHSDVSATDAETRYRERLRLRCEDSPPK